MTAIRVTQRSIASTALAGLQHNIAKLGTTQEQLSSGKQISKASDSPGGTVAAMQYRSDLATLKQYKRNADDGLGWLATADGTLTNVIGQIHRARDLVLQGKSSGSYGTPQAREAIALEVDNIRAAVIGLANTSYLGRPVFGGTTNGTAAYTPPDPTTNDPGGVYSGDGGEVWRTVGENTKVRVDVSGPEAFGVGNEELFTVLDAISTSLRTNPTGLDDDLTNLDAAAQTVLGSLSKVGARYDQLDQMRRAADDRAVSLTQQLSDVEDIDLPKTIADLSLQQTAYQAALAATARVVQPSLIDFLR